MQRVQADWVLNDCEGHSTGRQLHALCAGWQAEVATVHWTAWAAHRPNLLVGGAVYERGCVRKVGPQACRAMLHSGNQPVATIISAASQYLGPSAQHIRDSEHDLAAAAWTRLLHIRLHLDAEGLWPASASAQKASAMLSLTAGGSAHHAAASGG